MSNFLEQFTEPYHWAHLTLPRNQKSIEEQGIQTGYPFTERQLFEEYFPDSGSDDVIDAREYSEKLLERVRTEVYPGDSQVSPRTESVALWPSVETGYDMRSAVLGDSVDFVMVVVDAREIDSHRFVLSEYQLVCQVMMNASAHRGHTGEDISTDELVAPALRYWQSSMLTNQWESIEEQAEMYELPEIQISGGVSRDAIVATELLDAEEYEDSGGPPTVTPK